MSKNRRGYNADDGFTLIEIMIALAILGTSLFVLLDMHYNAVNIQSRLENEVRVRNLISQAVGIAEVEIAAGTLKDSQEFGDRYPGYRYTFDAQLVDGSSSSSGSNSSTAALSPYPGLYDVLVTVEDPDKNLSEIHFYIMTRDFEALAAQAGGEEGEEGDDSGDGAAGGDATAAAAAAAAAAGAS